MKINAGTELHSTPRKPRITWRFYYWTGRIRTVSATISPIGQILSNSPDLLRR